MYIHVYIYILIYIYIYIYIYTECVQHTTFDILYIIIVEAVIIFITSWSSPSSLSSSSSVLFFHPPSSAYLRLVFRCSGPCNAAFFQVFSTVYCPFQTEVRYNLLLLRPTLSISRCCSSSALMAFSACSQPCRLDLPTNNIMSLTTVSSHKVSSKSLFTSSWSPHHHHLHRERKRERERKKSERERRERRYIYIYI